MQQLCARQVMVQAWLNMSTALYTARQQNLGTAGVNVMLKYIDITVKIITVTQTLPNVPSLGCLYSNKCIVCMLC